MVKQSKSFQVQSTLLAKIKESLPPHMGMAEEIADILGVSTDSAYRRIRCETELSIDEAYQLSRKFNISMDSISASLGHTVFFDYAKLTEDEENFKKYLERIYENTKYLTTYTDKKVTYIAETFPLFYSFFSSKLTQFKLFYWQRSVLNLPVYEGKKFEFGLIPTEQVQLAMDSFKEYQTIPSIEVWTKATILTVLQQVEFYVESGVFTKKEDAFEIIEEIKKMANYLEGCCESGRKLASSTQENFTMYYSDVFLGSNCIYVNSGTHKYAYVSFNTINSLSTNNHEFCEESEHWVKNIIKKSTLISGVSEKERFKFFNHMYTSIDNCRARVLKIVEVNV